MPKCPRSEVCKVQSVLGPKCPGSEVSVHLIVYAKVAELSVGFSNTLSSVHLTEPSTIHNANSVSEQVMIFTYILKTNALIHTQKNNIYIPSNHGNRKSK